jgi:AcrR family transcriptional regulator
LRADLIAAADRILAQTGDLEALSLRGVAREVGIATPSIYLHFPDKQALVRAVLAERFIQLGAAVREAVMAASGPVEQFRAGCLAYCRFATEHPNAYRVLFGRLPAGETSSRTPLSGTERGDFTTDFPSPAHGGGAGGGGSFPASSLASAAIPNLPAGAAAFSFLVDGVSACMRAGLAPTGDPLRTAIAVWTALHGIVSLRASVPVFPWPPLQQQVDDVLSGLVGLRHNAVTGSVTTPE